MTYQAYSGDEIRSVELVRVMPRPSTAKALGYITSVIKKAREAKNMRDLSPIEFDALKALDTYWNDIPRDERHDPGENAKFDEKFSAWLRESSVWVPLKVLLNAKPEDLVAAGFPEAEVEASWRPIKELEQAEDRSPGQVVRGHGRRHARRSSRKLGEAVNPSHYPDARDDRAGDPLQRVQPVLAGPDRLRRGARRSWP